MGRASPSLAKKCPFHTRHLIQSSMGKQPGETCQDPAWFLAMTVVALPSAALVRRQSRSSPASKAPMVTRAVLPQQTLAELSSAFTYLPEKAELPA